jgi:long-chain fatty acid transport protein
LGLLFIAPALPAQDLSFHDVGARAAGLGGAFTARADDLTAVFYNPAGLAFLDGLRIQTSLTFASRTLSATRPETGEVFGSSPHELHGNFFLSWRPLRRISLGLGYYSPENFDSAWPSGWPADQISITATYKTRTLRSVVAVEPLNGLAISAALDLVSTHLWWDHLIHFEMDSYPIPDDTMITSHHELSGHGLGFAGGVLWKVLPQLRVGVRYQTRAVIDMAGKNTFQAFRESWYTVVPGPYGGGMTLTSLLNMFYVAQDVTSEMAIPREVACGIVVKPVPRLSLTMDIQWDRWSELGRWEFRSVRADGDLSPEFTEDYQEFYGIAPDYGTQGMDLAAGDTKRIKAGLEYALGRWFAVRAGYSRLESSVATAGRTPLYPDPRLRVYSFGAGYEGPMFSIWDEERSVGRLLFDVYLRYATAGGGSASELPGWEFVYRAKRWTAGVGVGFVF